MMRWALLILLLCSPVWASPTGNEELDTAILLYEDLEYEQAIAALEEALARPNLTRQELATGLRYLALSHVALGDDDGARGAYRRLLEADPHAELPETENEHARALLEEVRAEILPVSERVVLKVTGGGKARAGSPVSLRVSVDDATGTVTRLVLHHRVRGQPSYSVIEASAGERVEITIPGALVAGPALEYWIEAQAADGMQLTTLGTAETPEALVVVGSTKRAAAPVYKRWWFWTAVGGAVVAGALIGIAATSSDGGENATVTITVEPP